MAEARRIAWWRLATPNAFTAASIVFAVLAIEDAIAGRILAAAWWGLYGTLTDRLDGAAAKLLKASSEFGVQFDSLADLTIFGVVPSAVFYAFYARHPELGWSSPALRAALVAMCCAWTLATAGRLARFNVASAHGHTDYYRGTPSTMTAGIVGVAFLTVLKYSDPAWTAPETSDPWRLLGGARLDALLPWMPLALLIGAIGMLSPLRVPRLGRLRSRALTVLLAVIVAVGYTAGLFHRLPEYMLAGGLVYLVACVVFHLRTR
ncbi:MAG: CDP-alcohol phosphatidyltransferase [Myxococcales bacterium]|nr:CDP-alcohol phosphatidyltransferase [Myxococcales bacterium]